MPEEGREQRKKEQKNEDACETVQKIAVRQQVDDRIRVRVKEPVIIPENQLVKSGEKGIPVQKRTESGKKGQNGRNGRDDPEKNKPPFPDPEKSQRQKQDGAEDQKKLDGVKNFFDLAEMDPSFFRHGKRRKVKLSPVKKRIVVDQGVILFQDLRFGHGRKSGKLLIFDLLHIQRTKMKDQYDAE